MTFAEFVERLDKKNPLYTGVVRWLDLADKPKDNRPMVVERKDKNLLEIVRKMVFEEQFPLIDKKLGLVLGLPSSCHHIVRAALFAYHNAYRESDPIMGSIYMSADRYMDEGMGYYISAMEPHVLIVSNQYRPDRFDKELFPFYEVRLYVGPPY